MTQSGPSIQKKEKNHSLITIVNLFVFSTSTFNRMNGLVLSNKDEYAEFQSDLIVYHDDFADYSTNEPAMGASGTSIYLLALKQAAAQK